MWISSSRLRCVISRAKTRCNNESVHLNQIIELCWTIFCLYFIIIPGGLRWGDFGDKACDLLLTFQWLGQVPCQKAGTHQLKRGGTSSWVTSPKEHPQQVEAVDFVKSWGTYALLDDVLKWDPISLLRTLRHIMSELLFWKLCTDILWGFSADQRCVLCVLFTPSWVKCDYQWTES